MHDSSRIVFTRRLRHGTLVRAACTLLLLLCGARAYASTAPLADAAEKMDRARVRALLAEHASVNAAQADGMTALHWAVHYDDREMAEALVRAGANVKAANRYGVTSLSLACTNGNSAMVDLLLKAGADP
ncbi:MAG: ankyrin repeat domain-containing protein, partial [Burkholderiales bacterium]